MLPKISAYDVHELIRSSTYCRPTLPAVYIQEAYDHVKHPKFANGDWTQEQVLKSFIDDFRYHGAYCRAVHGQQKCERISKQEFFDYYMGHSTIIEKDVAFDYMMRHSWKF